MVLLSDREASRPTASIAFVTRASRVTGSGSGWSSGSPVVVGDVDHEKPAENDGGSSDRPGRPVRQCNRNDREDDRGGEEAEPRPSPSAR
jgi:hypothetical protein